MAEVFNKIVKSLTEPTDTRCVCGLKEITYMCLSMVSGSAGLTPLKTYLAFRLKVRQLRIC